MMDYSKRMSTIAEDMAPLQKQQLQFGLDTSKTSWEQGQADRTYSLGKRAQLSTLQDQQLADLEGNNVGQRTDQFAKTALADVNSSFSNSFAQNNRGMSRMGGNPASGAATSMQNQNALAQAAASANSMNQVRAAARQEGFALNDRASNSLAGYPSMAMSATGASQGYGTAGVGLTNSSLSGQTAGYTSAGNMAGSAGSNAASMYGAMGSYKNGQDQIASQNDPMNAILGAASGVGMAYGLKKFG
jgi:hypothetical protein